MLRTVPLTMLLALVACKGDTDDSAEEIVPMAWSELGALDDGATALSVDGDRVLAATGTALWRSDDAGATFTSWDRGALPSGAVSFLGAMPGGEHAVAWVDGRGLYHHDGSDWAWVDTQPSSVILESMNPRAQGVPFAFAPGAEGEAWMGVVGGLFHTTDHGLTWEQAVIPASVGFNILFTGLAVQGDTVVAVAPRPQGFIPEEQASLLVDSVFLSDDGGQTWEDLTGDAPFHYPGGVALDDQGRVLVAAMDGGLFRLDGSTWTSLGGPSDAVGLSWDEAGASVASASRGLWRWQEDGWTAVDAGAVVGVAQGVGLGVDGRVWTLEEGLGEAPLESAGGQVYVALSHHVNLYHSYRGDTNDDDGYGIDLDVMRSTLDTLDAHPQVHADWDIENYFSLDGWMLSAGIDVRERILARVSDGQDGLRLMSWNNGALAAEDREEFDLSISRAMDSYDAWVGAGGWDPGVQPQECMFTRDHVEWYSDHGIEWITLFYSGTPFTALRQELELPPEAWYAPITITEGSSSLTLVPAYHHADMGDHGGLAGWVQQLHDSHPGDSLLLIHFDADSETWVPFADELDALQGLDYVHFTTIQDYLDTHDPVLEVPAPSDVADGTGDGFQSWAEKHFNHEIATMVVGSRESAASALALAGSDPEVIALTWEAQDSRLLALSTTHFGLAAPYLHEDRKERALEYANDAVASANQALRVAEGSCGSVAQQTIEIHNTRDTGGTALVQTSLDIPEELWIGPEGVVVYGREGEELPVAVDILSGATDPVVVGVGFTVEVEPLEELLLSWDYDTTGAERALGSLTEESGGWDELPTRTPFTECKGKTGEASPGPHWNLSLDDRKVRAEETQRYDLPLCESQGLLDWTWQRWHGLEGVVLKVEGELGTPAVPEDAESIALSPLACEGPAEMLSWRSMGGHLRSRPVRQGQETWNASAADGWVELACAEGRDISVAHLVTQRTSLAFAPMRTSEQDALLAPLGTLWGDPPRHDARRTGGHGMGDVVAGIVGSQFAPAAPDWTGQWVSYTLLVGDELDPGDLDLFAHPPVVRSGPLTGG